ncbi:uncharacterized protein IAS62_006644 [Cryptococcus decagattii]|uniref:Uncharacterized protein n=1 Tax=Cryptococcus decagattii TaxID=1859122 RepID=A0ABZ2B363_9TREE
MFVRLNVAFRSSIKSSVSKNGADLMIWPKNFIFSDIYKSTKIGLMKMHSSEDAYHILKSVQTSLLPRSTGSSNNTPPIIPPSSLPAQNPSTIIVHLQPGYDFQDVIIPIIDEVVPFQAPPPRKIDLLSTYLPDDVEATTVRQIMDII